MAVSKRLRAIYDGFWEGMETKCHNVISNFMERRIMKKNLKSTPPISLKIK